MTDISPSDEMRAKILGRALLHAPFEGWTAKVLRLAVAECELPGGAEDLYFPGGAVELISFWSAQCDASAAQTLSGLNLSKMKIRERVTAGVIARLEAIGRHEEAARRAIATLALPIASFAGGKCVWASADMIWRAIGDTSTDGNFYSKRGVLCAVISTSLMRWLSDETEDKREARAFLDRRIENVMQFEKTKAKARDLGAHLPDPIAALSALRHGKKRRPYQPRR